MYAQHDILQLEQDLHGSGDALPTYDHLAEQSGPNSRFGRWRGWIEKRAAERYRDISNEELSRRRARGWGGDDVDSSPLEESQVNNPMILNEPPATSHAPNLHLNTELPPLQQENTDSAPPSSIPHSSHGERLFPSRLRVNQFGSRFLPHAESRIRCLLPLLNDQLLLIGHDEGLSALDMFPQEWSDTGSIVNKGPGEAIARLMWRGEAVYQMSILEIKSTGEGIPQGVVLLLVGPEVEYLKDQESLRTLRMYNLASLISLAKYTVAQKGTCHVAVPSAAKVENQQSPAKKPRHRSQNSITKSLRSLIESPVTQSVPHSLSYQSLMPPNPYTGNASIIRTNSAGSNVSSSWDIVDDLPLRWATDYVGLATIGSRLIHTSVICYALWRDSNSQGQGALLAVATKSNVLLYEKPKGERAFRFVKEFYTPQQARSLDFILQSVQDVTHSSSDVGYSSSSRPRPVTSADVFHDVRSTMPIRSSVTYSAQLSLFVIFDKKAGVIRLADSAVSEVDLASDWALSPDFSHTRELSSSSGSRRSRLSDAHSLSKGLWVLPTRMDLPAVTTGPQQTLPRTVYFLTRGKQTQVLPSPLPAAISNTPPLLSLAWDAQPSSVTPRICYPPEDGSPPFLQLVALGEDGLEVQEVSLSCLNGGKGKGRSEEALRASLDISAGFLCTGGLWHRPEYPPQLGRSLSDSSSVSETSFHSLNMDKLVSTLQTEQGIYGWCQKDISDWRVFWVGGTGRREGEDMDFGP